MAKLSETFVLKGGSNTALPSINQNPTSNNTNSSRKLSETFTLGQPLTISQPTKSTTAVPTLNEPKVEQPTMDYDAIIKEYESLPKTNIFSRLFNKKSEEAYNRKQELNPLYERAKDVQTRQKLSSLGLDEKDVRNAYDESWGYGLYKVEDLLKGKGITDKKELNALINDIDKMFTRTAQSEANERNTKFAEEHPVLGSALTVPSKALVGMGNVIESGTNYLTGNPMSNTSGSLAANKGMNEMRNTVSKDMNGVGKFLYGSGMSMADMLANRWLLGGAGNLSMGFEKGADTMNEAIDQGLNPTQIMGKGLASGATTYVTEKLLTSASLDKAQDAIYGIIKEGGVKALGKGGIVKVLLPLLAKTGASEGTQEGLENIADTIADLFIAGNKNQLKQSYDNYKANGLSDDEAMKKVAGDKAIELLQDTAGGFLSGVLMGGAEMGKSGVEYKLNNRNNQNNLPGFDQSKSNTEVPAIQNTQQIEQTTAPTENEVNVSPTFADDVAKIRKTLGDDVAAARDWSNQYAIDFKDSLETLKNNPTEQNYDNAVKALDAYEANLPESANVDTNLRDALTNLSAEFGIEQNATSVDNISTKGYNQGTTTEVEKGVSYDGREESSGYDGRGSDRLLGELPTREQQGIDGLHSLGTPGINTPSSGSSSSSVLGYDNKVFSEDIDVDPSVSSFDFRYSNNNAQDFHDAFEAAKASNDHGGAVDSHSIEDLQKIVNDGGNLFMSADKTAFGAVTGDGNLTSVAKAKNSPHKAAAMNIAKTAVKLGATKGDCYGKALVNMYAPAGFKPVARCEYAFGFNDAMDAQVREQLENGEIAKAPDVYALVYDNSADASKKYSQSELDALPLYEGESAYDDMLTYRDSLLEPNTKEASTSKELPGLNKIMKEDTGINGHDAKEESFSSKISYPINSGVPSLQEGNTKTTQTARNSLAKLFSQKDESLKQHIQDVEDRKYQYEVQPMVKTEQAARDRIMKYGADNVYDDIIKSGVNTLNDFATAVNLQLWYDSQGDTVKKHILGQKISAGLTPAAQMLQYCNVYGDSALGMEQATDALAGSQIKEYKNKAKKHKGGKENKQLSEAEKTANELTEEVKKDNTKSAKLAKALALIGNDFTKENAVKEPKSFEKIMTEVNNTLDQESASIEFSDTAKNFIVAMIQENVNTKTMADEIKHYLDHGEFYTLDESIKLPEPTSARLNSILSQMGNDGAKKETAPLSYEQIREQVKNTLGKEMAKVDFSEEEISYLARMLEYGASNEDIMNALVRKIATKHMAIPDDAISEINYLYKQAEQAPTSKERAELKEQAAAIAAEYSGTSTFMDKWNAWRYLAMLGNPRTLIRNRLGNFTFRQVTNIKDFVAAGLENAAQAAGIKFDRTKSMSLNPVTDADLFKASRADFDNVAYEEATRGGSKYNMKSAVEGKRKVFDAKGIEWLRDKVSNQLEQDDIKALKAKYTQALAGYLKANGYGADVLKTDNAILDKARAYAIQQAKIATFHEDSKAANLLNDLERRVRESGGLLGKTAEVLMESTMPFKKTPINILKQGVQYSPASLLSAAYHIATKADANVWIDDLAKSLTGTTIMMIGYWLGKNGLLIGQRKDDDDPFNKGSNYALTVGNKSFTIDWLAPAALPLFVGCELADSVSDKSDSNGLALLETVASISEPVVEMSMMQGLENALSSLSNIKNFKGATFLENIGAGYASQVVPTLSGQLARTIDPLRRTTRTSDSSYEKPLEATLEKAKQKVVNKLPGLSMTNEPYLNAWGESEKNANGLFGGNVVGRALQNFVLPGYVNDTSLSKREEGLVRLEDTYKKNGYSGSLIPSLADDKPNGTRLTNAEYTKWAQTRGNELKKAVDAGLMYKNKVSTKDLQGYMHELELLANAIAKHNQFGTEIPKTYKKKYEAYKDGGYSYSAVIKYLIENSK